MKEAPANRMRGGGHSVKGKPLTKARPRVGGVLRKCAKCGGDIYIGPKHGNSVKCDHCGTVNVTVGNL